MLEDGVIVGRIFFLDAVGPQGRPRMWASGHNGETPRGARLRGDARGCHGGVREELATRVRGCEHESRDVGSRSMQRA